MRKSSRQGEANGQCMFQRFLRMPNENRCFGNCSSTRSLRGSGAAGVEWAGYQQCNSPRAITPDASSIRPICNNCDITHGAPCVPAVSQPRCTTSSDSLALSWMPSAICFDLCTPDVHKRVAEVFGDAGSVDLSCRSGII